MRTTASNQWVWLFAGALPALAFSAACGDDTTATTTGTSEGGFGGFGGSDTTAVSTATTGAPTSSSSGQQSSSQQNSASNSASQGTGGDGGNGSTGPGSGGGGSGQGGSGPECGNGLLEDGEVCDGDELGDASCEGEGFFTGTISCDNCELDTSACTDCGNDSADPGEDCDGDDLDNNDCTDVDPDFVGGTLACANDCTFDTLGCVNAECNDGEVNGNEECEVGMLGGRTCVDEGFVSGTLACTNCQYDPTPCVSCGDNAITGDDVCDGTDLGGQTCADVGLFTGGTLACDPDCGGFDDTGCTNFPQPGVGELVITEIMINPTGNPNPFPDATAEWFEVTNPSIGTTYQLQGCEVTSNNDGIFTVLSDFEIAPGESVTFAKSLPGFTADFSYDDGFAFAQSSDTVSISCDGTEVDVVAYSSGAGFSVPAARSISLDPGSFDAIDNDDGANWCDASTTSVGFTSGDFGTPGETNPACGAGNFTIDFCELQSPLTITGVEGSPSGTVYGQVRIDGLTDLTDTNDLNALVIASVGFGPDGTDPATDLSWTFIAATPNGAYNSSSPGYTVNQDEYQGSFNIPAAAGSPYDYAFRFSGDGGATWTYCDSTGGAYTPADAGQMTSTASGVDYSALFFSEYIEAPSGNGSNKVLELYNSGSSSINLGACELRLYNDGSGTPNNVVDATSVLSGSILASDTLVICHTSADQPDPPTLCDLRINGGVMNFNGDDTVGLWCASNPIDVIGQIGVDPGSAFGTAPITTADRILRRRCNTSGDTDPLNAFDPAAGFSNFAYDSVTMDADLGTFVCIP